MIVESHSMTPREIIRANSCAYNGQQQQQRRLQLMGCCKYMRVHGTLQQARYMAISNAMVAIRSFRGGGLATTIWWLALGPDCGCRYVKPRAGRVSLLASSEALRTRLNIGQRSLSACSVKMNRTVFWEASQLSREG